MTTDTEQLQTPYFVIDEPILQRYYDMLVESLSSNWNNYLIGYSFKTNSLPWLVSYVKKRGAYAEVVSEDEYSLAKYMGYRNDEIIYNGPYKGQQSFCDVLLAGGVVNLDSMQEIRWLTNLVNLHPDKPFEVGIRANFNLEQMCPGETTMGEVSGRFGFCYETGKFAEALKILRSLSNVSVTGLHLHSSSKSRSVNIFRSIARMACQLKTEFDLNLKYVDLGGGYCGGMEGRPEYPDYFPVVAEELRECFTPEETMLIVEPGISLISKCTAFVTSVFDTRDIKGTRYVMTDGSRFNIDPTMIKSSHLFHVEYTTNYGESCADNDESGVSSRSVFGSAQNNCDSRPDISQQIISGFTCMEVDRLFTYKDQPELIPGDRIIYENVGGYTMSLNPLFIQYFPAVYVKNGDEMRMVRKKWTPAEYVQGSEWEM
ncbi:MAG: pyridoxal-dependent decarboxylase [Lachnospiraceae bacterium]|nr:pyridoxal-dependent decarboxylase [Lachnospiraceae bacterium]